MNKKSREIDVRSVPERVAYLLVLLINEQLNPEEQVELSEWVAESEQNVEILNQTVDNGGATYFPYGYRVTRKR